MLLKHSVNATPRANSFVGTCPSRIRWSLLGWQQKDHLLEPLLISRERPGGDKWCLVEAFAVKETLSNVTLKWFKLILKPRWSTGLVLRISASIFLISGSNNSKPYWVVQRMTLDSIHLLCLQNNLHHNLLMEEAFTSGEWKFSNSISHFTPAKPKCLQHKQLEDIKRKRCKRLWYRLYPKTEGLIISKSISFVLESTQ